MTAVGSSQPGLNILLLGTCKDTYIVVPLLSPDCLNKCSQDQANADRHGPLANHELRNAFDLA